MQQQLLSTAVIANEETLTAIVRNLRRRLQMVLDADGGHIGNAFNVIFNLPRLLKSETPNTAMVAM